MSFLDLPSNIRLKVYTFAGLVRPCPVSLTQDPPCRRPVAPWQIANDLLPQIPPWQGPPNWDYYHWEYPEFSCFYRLMVNGGAIGCGSQGRNCYCPPFPKQILVLSKAFYKDAIPILYSKNKFVLRAHKPEDLQILSSLNQQSIYRLQEIMVRLNSWPCPRGHSWVVEALNACMLCNTSVSEGEPLLRLQDAEMLREWDRLCGALTVIPYGQLKLTFIADVDDYETAERFVRPLQTLLPRLEGCTIRLGRDPSHSAASLAYSFSTKKSQAGTLGTTPPFLFESLPEELRVQILSYTDLGRDCIEPRVPTIFIQNNRLVQRRGRGSWMLRVDCCDNCTFTKLDCCCSLPYAAYSPTCQCRSIPSALAVAYTSKQMKADATRVLYSSSCFRFEQPFPTTLAFLRERPQLQWFRRISLQIQCTQAQSWETYDQDWTRLIMLMRDQLNVPNLLLAVNFANPGHHCLEDNILFDDTMWRIYVAYISMARTVRENLATLRDFHVLLGHFKDLEPRLEKHVMGPSYDSRVGNRDAKELLRDYNSEDFVLPSWHREDVFAELLGGS